MASILNKYVRMLLLTSDDGRVVFYPFGPFRGYLVDEPALESFVVSQLKRWALISATMTIGSLLLGIALHIGPETSLAVSLFDLVWYAVFVHMLTKPLLALPLALSFRFNARWRDEERLWQQFGSASILAVVNVWMLQVIPGVLSFSFTALFTSLSVLSGTLLYVRKRELRQFENDLCGRGAKR